MFKRIDTITGVVLTGGRSLYDGSDPALREFDGESFLRRSLRLMYSVFSDVIVIADSRSQYESLNIPACTRIIRTESGLADIHSALVNAPTEDVFLVPCDLPFLRASVINYVVERAGAADVTLLNSGGRVQPMCGLYRSTCLMPLMENVLRNRHSVQSLLNRVSTAIITPDSAYEPMVAHAFHPLSDSLPRFTSAAFSV